MQATVNLNDVVYFIEKGYFGGLYSNRVKAAVNDAINTSVEQRSQI